MLRHGTFDLGRLLSLLATALALTGCRGKTGVPRDGEWLHWRGPRHDGSSSATNLPVRWTRKEHVAWSTRLPGRGSSTPVVTRDRIFLTAECDGFALTSLCLDRSTGAKLWQRTLGTGRELDQSDCATPSPVTDGERACFLFGNGLLAATDLDGNVLWQRNLEEDYGRFEIRFGFSASPLLCDGRLFVSVIQGDPDNQEPTETNPASAAYLLAVDPATGETLWKKPRPCDALGEGQEGYASPIPRQGKHGTEIVTIGGDCVTAHDPAAGDELWRWKGYNEDQNPVGRVIPSPVVVEDMVVACAPQYGGVFAFRPESPATNDAGKVAWFVDGGPDVTTPLYYGDLLYFIIEGDPAVLAVDVRSGEIVWIEELPAGGIARGSLTGADGKLYTISDSGDVVVLKTGRKFGVLSTFAMPGDGGNATIVAAGEDLYIRTGRRLYAVHGQR